MGLTAGLLLDLLNISVEVNKNGKAAIAVWARFTGMFLSDLCLCAKAYVL